MKVAINGRPVAETLDVAEKAGGYAKPLDLFFERIRPEHGIIEIRFTGTEGGEAMIQACLRRIAGSAQFLGVGRSC